MPNENTLPTPETRREMFLAAAAGESVSKPEPITREEMFLDAISSGGAGDAYTKAETDVLLAGKQNTLTTAQQAAADSGITSAKVAQYDEDSTALVEIVDSGAKNMADMGKSSYSTTTSKGATVTLTGDTFTVTTPAGETTDDDNNIFFNIYFDTASTCILPPGSYAAMLSGTGIDDISVRPVIDSTVISKPYGEPVFFDIPSDASNNWVRINLKGLTSYNATFKLMICPKALYDVSSKYVPYCPSMEELYETIGDVNTVLEEVL